MCRTGIFAIKMHESMKFLGTACL